MARSVRQPLPTLAGASCKHYPHATSTTTSPLFVRQKQPQRQLRESNTGSEVPLQSAPESRHPAFWLVALLFSSWSTLHAPGCDPPASRRRVKVSFSLEAAPGALHVGLGLCSERCTAVLQGAVLCAAEAASEAAADPQPAGGVCARAARKFVEASDNG